MELLQAIPGPVRHARACAQLAGRCKYTAAVLILTLVFCGCRQTPTVTIKVPAGISTTITGQPPFIIVLTNMPGPILTNVAAPILTNVPAPALSNLPAPIFTNIAAPVLTNVPAPVGANISAPLFTNVAAPILTNMPAEVRSNVPAPVLTNVPAPILSNIAAPVLTNMPAPVRSNIPAPVLTNIPAPVLTNVAAPPAAPAGSGLKDQLGVDKKSSRMATVAEIGFLPAFGFLTLAGLLGALCSWIIEANGSDAPTSTANVLKDPWNVLDFLFALAKRTVIGITAACLGPLLCSFINPDIFKPPFELPKVLALFSVSVALAFSGQTVLLLTSAIVKTKLIAERARVDRERAKEEAKHKEELAALERKLASCGAKPDQPPDPPPSSPAANRQGSALGCGVAGAPEVNH